ncbi:MAG: hypothetical protein M0C28_18385 [Candidatus Moduliflexus flocculans]|nr:hypothetical protein [Candidatus Moduliflexus flocculans]
MRSHSAHLMQASVTRKGAVRIANRLNSGWMKFDLKGAPSPRRRRAGAFLALENPFRDRGDPRFGVA